MKRIATLGLLFGVSLAAAGTDGPANKPPAGFTTLFNGKDLSDWKVTKAQAQAWKVENGTIHYTGKGGSNLATAKNYKDFELWVDWKITPKGDSGIYLRGQPRAQAEIATQVTQSRLPARWLRPCCSSSNARYS